MKSEKIILAIESSDRIGSVSLLRGQKEIGFWISDEGESMSQNLILGIKNLLENHNIKKKEINLVAVSNGPGSLTGIRVGISVAKGLAFAIGAKCVGISLLEAMFTFAGIENQINFAIISGGRNQLYWQRIDNKKKLNSIAYGTYDDFANEFKMFPNATVIMFDHSNDLIPKIDLDKERLYVCSEKPSYLIGSEAFLVQQNKSDYLPAPLYIQAHNFKKVSNV